MALLLAEQSLERCDYADAEAELRVAMKNAQQAGSSRLLLILIDEALEDVIDARWVWEGAIPSSGGLAVRSGAP